METAIQEKLALEPQNILMFEGAGYPDTGSPDIKNCRIRTFVTNNEGVKIFVEINGHKTTPYSPEPLKCFEFGGWVQCCELPDGSSYCNPTNAFFEYNKKSVVDWINKNLNCSYTDMTVDENLNILNEIRC